MQAWSTRPLLGVYAAIFIDAIYVKVRDGQVGNLSVSTRVGPTVAVRVGSAPPWLGGNSLAVGY